MKQKEESEFNRLPDELVVAIFNKIRTLKYLCACSLVCTRFSSLVPLVHSVSFSVPPRSSPTPELNPEVQSQNFPPEASQISTTTTNNPPHPRPFSVSDLRFLSKFEEIHSLEMELPSYVSDGCDQFAAVIKWRAAFGVQFKTFLFFSATSVQEKKNQFDGEEDVEQEEEEGPELVAMKLEQGYLLAFQCLKDALAGHLLLLILIEGHRKMRSFAFSDSKRRGLLSAADEKLVELRVAISSGPKVDSFNLPVSVVQGYVPVLRLPLSGCVMKGAMLVVMRMVDEDSNGGGDVGCDLASLFRGDEEAAFGEAVTEMMVKHKSKMKTLL